VNFSGEIMKCPNCGSKTPKEVKIDQVNIEKEILWLDGYSVSTTKPIYQCKSKSCNCAFNPMVVQTE